MTNSKLKLSSWVMIFGFFCTYQLKVWAYMAEDINMDLKFIRICNKTSPISIREYFSLNMIILKRVCNVLMNLREKFTETYSFLHMIYFFISLITAQSQMKKKDFIIVYTRGKNKTLS